MDAIRFRSAKAAALAVALLLGASAGAASAREPLRDAAPVWYDDDTADIPQPESRDPNLMWDGIDDSVSRPLSRLLNPARAVRRVGSLFGGDHVPPAANVNALDEVPNSSWFVNRIGLYALSPSDAAKGPGDGDGPDRSAPWTVISAKTQGVTPGFNIRDSFGDVYVIKFDLPEFDGHTITVGVISSRIMYAAGYNTPDDAITTFRREGLLLGENVSIKLRDGTKRPMTEADIDSILAHVASAPDGSYRAIASKFLSGKPVGPFNYKGRRKDDPNDRIDHEDRRELRALRLFASWLHNFDTKQHNSLDMFVEENGRHYVKHHLIDFTGTLGAAGRGPVPRYGYEYTLDMPSIFARIGSLGFHEDGWRKIDVPEGLSEVGYYESKEYEPYEFDPLQHNTAFDNMTDRDGYWAAKIISAFTDEHLAAIVAEAKYRDPAASAYMAKTIAERRDKIVRAAFDRVPPLDFFRIDGDVVGFRDLGVERNAYPEASIRYRVRCGAANADRGVARWSEWTESERNTTIDLSRAPANDVIAAAAVEKYPFVAIECQVDRGDGWSPTVTAYVTRASKRVVAVDR
jgi:hypothetical protein